MTNELKIDFINITLDSFNNGNFNYEKVENIIIEYCNCNSDKLDLNKLLKFKNLQTLSIIPGEKDYEEYYISIYLAPLLKFSSLKKVYLEGKCLMPYGLSSNWEGKGNFSINTKIPDIVLRMGWFSNDSNRLTFDGTNINYFDNINFDEFFEIFERSLTQVDTLILDDFRLNDQFDEGKIIDLSPFSKLKNLKKFSINNSDSEDLGGPYYNFDTFPMFEKLEYLHIDGHAYNYDFIKNLNQLKELEIDCNAIAHPKFFSTKEIRPLLNLKKIEIAYSEMSLITDFSQHYQNFPNLEELSFKGFFREEREDDYGIDPKAICVFTNLKTLRMPISNFLSSPKEIVDNNHELEEYEKALDWCLKRLIDHEKN